MKSKFILITILAVPALILNVSTNMAQKKENQTIITVSLQKRIPSDIEKDAWVITDTIQQWRTDETAIIICDMWDKHWCRGASERVAELAPFINNVISIARKKGILIVHAPSETIKYYKDYPERRLGKKYTSKNASSLISRDLLPSEKNAVWPIDQSDEGCDDTPECKLAYPWTHEIDIIKIYDGDAISDSGAEIAGLFYARRIKNVILMGVHTNMCVIGRSFGLRNMIRLGFNVVLMRDLTDTMYDSKQPPMVNHFSGNSLIFEYIEKYVCPTMVSTDFTGEKQFRFKKDSRPVVAFITAENENSTSRNICLYISWIL